jgi:hypothetical protein
MPAGRLGISEGLTARAARFRPGLRPRRRPGRPRTRLRALGPRGSGPGARLRFRLWLRRRLRGALLRGRGAHLVLRGAPRRDGRRGRAHPARRRSTLVPRFAFQEREKRGAAFRGRRLRRAKLAAAAHRVLEPEALALIVADLRGSGGRRGRRRCRGFRSDRSGCADRRGRRRNLRSGRAALGARDQPADQLGPLGGIELARFGLELFESHATVLVVHRFSF